MNTKKRFQKTIALILFTLCILTGCNSNENKLGHGPQSDMSTNESGKKDFSYVRDIVEFERQKIVKQTMPETVFDEFDIEEQKDPLDEYIAHMTLEEKIGQMFIVSPKSLEDGYEEEGDNKQVTHSETIVSEAMIDSLQKYNIGGVCLFRKNIDNPEQLKEMTDTLQRNSRIGLFVSIDEEGGKIVRLSNNKKFQVPNVGNMEAVGNTKDTTRAYEIGVTIGDYLSDYGFNLDFAPVADVNTNPNNRVIGNRSFGSNPEEVGDMVKAAIEGFHDKRVMTCAKHFPGHGDTNQDTHKGYALVQKTWEEMLDCEIIPFQAAIEADTDFIMVAHITAENISDDGLPASLSRTVVTEKLRNELNYQGIIITDSMTMGAIHKNFSSGESTVLAVKAGVDIVLLPFDFKEAYNAVLDAVKSGEIPESQIDDSVKRILKAKKDYELFE